MQKIFKKKGTAGWKMDAWAKMAFIFYWGLNIYSRLQRTGQAVDGPRVTHCAVPKLLPHSGPSGPREGPSQRSSTQVCIKWRVFVCVWEREREIERKRERLIEMLCTTSIIHTFLAGLLFLGSWAFPHQSRTRPRSGPRLRYPQHLPPRRAGTKWGPLRSPDTR